MNRFSMPMTNAQRAPHRLESLLFFLLLSGPPRLRSRDPTASLSGQIDWAVMVDMAIWGLGALWVLHRFNTLTLVHKRLPTFHPLHWLAVLLVVFLGLSTFVSLAPQLTIYRVGQTAIAISFIYFWIGSFGLQMTARHVLISCLVLVVIIALLFIVQPGLVARGDRIGGGNVANSSSVAVFGLIFLLGWPDLIRWRSLCLLGLGLCAVLTVMSRTRSGYIAMLGFLLLAVIRFPRSSPLRRALYIMLVLGLIILLLGDSSTVLSWLIRDEASLSSLSERIPLWHALISSTIARSPWLGFGFYANRSVALSFNAGLGTSHSAFIEILSGGGLLSFAMLLFALIGMGLLLLRAFASNGQTAEVFTITSLFCALIFIGLVSEEMVIASPSSFVFWGLFSLIPVLLEETAQPTNTRMGAAH